MYGLIGKMIAAPGKRDELISVLLEGVATMPGCLSYIVAKDTGDANAIWITETWDSKASHDASLSLPSVKEAIAKGRPLIAGFGDRIGTGGSVALLDILMSLPPPLSIPRVRSVLLTCGWPRSAGSPNETSKSAVSLPR